MIEAAPASHTRAPRRMAGGAPPTAPAASLDRVAAPPEAAAVPAAAAPQPAPAARKNKVRRPAGLTPAPAIAEPVSAADAEPEPQVAPPSSAPGPRLQIDSLPRSEPESPEPADDHPHRVEEDRRNRSAAPAMTLAGEAALLEAAVRASRSRDWSAVLAATATHAARFPHGALELERDALRAVAFCRSGKLADGRALLASPGRWAHAGRMADQARRACSPRDGKRR
jgi:hypothetical protein